MPIFRTYSVLPGTTISETVPNWPFVCQLLSSTPSWFDPYVWFGFWFTGYSFTAPLELGTFQVDFQCAFSTPLGSVLIDYNIIIVVSAQIIAIPVEVCCVEKKQCNIAWLPREGGWVNWIFTGIRTVKVKMKRANTFKQLDECGDLALKYSERPDIYDALICTSGDITLTQTEYLDSLKESIQAFAYNDDNGRFDIPVLVDSKSYTKYKTKDKFFEVKVSFIFATEIKVQTQ